MDESNQKMDDLKKAYADIIFNTTKEAAARILIAEKRSSQYQKEKFEAKQEALNMLVRLKALMDSKIGELEFISLYQKRKIGELEAQVNRAEGVSNDLRVELKEVKEELEKMKSSRQQHLDTGLVKTSTPCSGELETQVSKPEDVAHDLREELKKVKEELEKMKNCRQQHLDSGLVKTSAPCSGELEAQVSKPEDVAHDLREELKKVNEELEKMKNSRQQRSDAAPSSGELEAHVSKAEGVARKLREELKEVKEELEKMKNSRQQHLDSELVKASAPSNEELEAQVSKAEGVANDLRKELKEVKEELEKLKNSRLWHLNKGLARASATSSGDASQRSQPVNSESFVYYPWNSGHIPLSFSKTDANRHQTHTNDHCSSGSGHISLQNGRQDNSPEDKCSAGNPTLSSMMRTIKKPHLYRPGCTQRIHAIQRNFPNENLCLPAHADNLSSHEKSKTSNLGLMQENQSRVGGLFEKGKHCDKGQDIECFKVPSSKRGSASRKARASLCTSQAMKTPVGITPSADKCPDNSITESSEGQSRKTEEIDNRVSNFTSTTGDVFSAADIVKTKGNQNASNGDEIIMDEADLRTQENQDVKGSEFPELMVNQKKFQVSLKSYTVGDVLITEKSKIATNGHKALIGESNLTTRENQTTENSEIPESALNREKDQVPLTSSDIKDTGDCEMNDRTPKQDVEDKSHKSTFRRKKRKRTSLRRIEERANHEKNNSKKNKREVQSNVAEPSKSILTGESSRDDLRLMLAARQVCRVGPPYMFRC